MVLERAGSGPRTLGSWVPLCCLLTPLPLPLDGRSQAELRMGGRSIKLPNLHLRTQKW